MTKFVSTLQLPTSIGLDGPCLGKRYRAHIGRVPVTLTLPRINPNDHNLLPPQVDDLPSGPGTGLTTGDGPFRDFDSWGNAVKRIDGVGGYAGGWVRACAVEFKVRASDFLLENAFMAPGQPRGNGLDVLFRAVDEWTEEVLLWTAVITGQDTHHREPVGGIRVAGEGLTVVCLTDQGPSHPTTGGMAYMSRPRAIPVLALAQFRKVLAAVSSGQEVPESQILLRDAKVELRRQRNRRAVIDAGTAAELVIADWNRRHANIAPNRGHPTLGWLVNNAGAPVPTNTTPDLVRIRNSAVHENYLPTSAEARTAIDVAEHVVNQFQPLPF